MQNSFEDTEELKYRDLTDPEKIRLFKNTDLRQQFPRLSTMTKSNNYGVIFSPSSMT